MSILKIKDQNNNWQSVPAMKGDPGVSPAVTVETIQGGHQVTITDATHPQGQSFNVMDGVGGGISDVPVDGKAYVRKDAEWIEGVEKSEMQTCARRVSTLSFYVKDNILQNATIAHGDGWSGDIQALTHASGTTSIAEFQQATESGKKYLLTMTANKSSFSENYAEVAIGDTPYCDLYNGTSQFIVGFISDGGHLKIKVDKTLAITFTNIALYEISTEANYSSIIEFTTNSVISIDSNDTDNVTGWWNVAIGVDNSTQGKNVNGSRNIAIGKNSQSKLVGGSRNIAIGTFSMWSVSQGDRNIAIGADSMYVNSNNTCTANDNIAIGKASLKAGSNLNNNTAIGNSAMGSCSETATGNVSIGAAAGRYAANYNVNLGMRAGYFNSGSNNVAIGYSAGPASSQQTLSNTIAIGYNAVVTKQKQMVLGNPNYINEVVIAGKKINFNEDGTVTWTSIE